MGPCRSQGSPWHEWSRGRFTETVVPFLEALVVAHPDLANPDADSTVEQEAYDEDAVVDLAVLEHGHIACLLQEFEEFHQIPVGDDWRTRVEALIAQFPL